MRAALALLAALVVVTPAGASTSVWIRGSGPPATTIISPGCTFATPTVCTVKSVAGLAVGNRITVWGACATDGLHNISSANGDRKIGAIDIVGNTISLQDTTGTDGVADGAPIAGNGPWCSGAANGWAAGPQYVGKLTQFTLVDSPRATFDGPSGTLTRKWALGTQNGMDNVNGIVCGSGICTVTVTYDITCVGSGVGICMFDKFTLWSTTSSTLTASPNPFLGTEYTVLNSPMPTAHTFSFASAATGNFTHNDACGAGATPNGTIQGTDNCVRISFMINSGNWQWTAAMNRNANYTTGAYRWTFQGGGGTGYGVIPINFAYIYALAFMADQTQSGYLVAGLNVLNNLELADGGNFISSNIALDGGNYDLSAEVNGYQGSLALVYSTFGPYLTPTLKQTFLDKSINDISDPTPCTPSLPAPVALNSGTAQAASSSSITLAVSASAVDNFYVNNLAFVTLAGGAKTVGLITAYVGATKVATVASWSGGTPTAGNAYAVDESSSVASAANGATTTMTGYNTHWNSPGPDQIHVGDYVFALNGDWGFYTVSFGYIGSYVTALNSDTSITVINGQGIFSSTTPAVTWISPHYVPGNCGWQYLQNSWAGAAGSQPIQYPIRGGSAASNTDGTPNLGSNITGDLQAAQIAFYLSCAGDDPRCATNLAKYSVPAVDFNLSLDMSYYTGFTYSGVSYGPGRASQGAYNLARVLKNSVIGYPSLDTTGPWVAGLQAWKMYAMWPDTPWFATGPFSPNHEFIAAYYGTGFGLSQWGPGQGHSSDMATDFGCDFAPTSLMCKYTTFFLRNVIGYTSSSSVASGNLAGMATLADPRLYPAAISHTAQPTQYLFQKASRTAAVALSGWLNPATWRGDAFISRTGWSNPSDTLIQCQARAYVGDHDAPQAGACSVRKVGALLDSDDTPPGDATNSNNNSYLQFGNVTTFKAEIGNGGPAVAYISRWAGSVPYGDANSRYVAATIDLTGAYVTPLTRALKYAVHLKDAGVDEALITFVDVASPSPIVINDQLFYPQNGETPVGGNADLVYPEGDTTCPGIGGCGAVNTNRQILEQEDGLSSNGDPLRQYNLVTEFFSPGNICVQWDGTTYPNATGHAYRARVFGGPTCGGTSTSLESLVVHKIAVQPDTTLNVTELEQDANWSGVNLPNAAVLFARGGVTHATLTAPTVTLANPSLVILHGLTAGTYTMTVGGFNCGSITVVDANNVGACRVTSAVTAGAVVLTQAPPIPGSSGSGIAKGSGSATAHEDLR